MGNKNSINSNILLVDDSREVASALVRELKKEPYQVITARSGEEALDRLRETPCKVIVADVKMPKMDGFELLAAVRKKHPEVIRVILSGHADIKLILRLVNEKGIDRYLTKPWESEVLKWTIRQSIELYDLREEVRSLRRQIRS